MKGRWAPRLRTFGVWSSFTFLLNKSTFYLLTYLCKLPKGGPLKYFSYQHDVCTYESENNKDAFNDAVCHYSVNMHMQLSSGCHYCHCDLKKCLLVFSCTIIYTQNRATTCLENLEVSGNLIAVREMSGILLKIREMSEKILWEEKLPKTVYCLSIHVFSRSLPICVKC